MKPEITSIPEMLMTKSKMKGNQGKGNERRTFLPVGARCQ